MFQCKKGHLSSGKSPERGQPNLNNLKERAADQGDLTLNLLVTLSSLLIHFVGVVKH